MSVRMDRTPLHHSSKRHNRIPGLWTQVLDAGLWMLDSGRQILNAGLSNLDHGLYAELWTLDPGLWTFDAECYTLDAELWTLHTIMDCFTTKSEASFYSS